MKTACVADLRNHFSRIHGWRTAWISCARLSSLPARHRSWK